MPKFILGYHGGSGMPDSEEEQAEIMSAWGAWFAEMGESVVDPGNPVGAAQTVASDGSVSDGGGENALTGYSLIEADDLAGAVAKAQGCPGLGSGGSVEVAETIEM